MTGIGLRCSVKKEVGSGGLYSTNFTRLGEKIEIYLLQSHSHSTNSKYFYAFKRWEQFISKEDGSSMPATPIHVALYLTHLRETGSSYSVIQSAVYGINGPTVYSDVQIRLTILSFEIC